MRPSRVLMISPHFPPDSSAGAHRVRLLAPHLRSFGWEPTVVTVDPRDYAGRPDPELAALVPDELRVIRCRAWPAQRLRRFGIGDLGARALHGLHRATTALCRQERFDAVFITLYPTYPAILGPLLKRRFDLPFVLDYQDPWVGAWGDTVGGAPDGGPDWKSRATLALARVLEPRVLRAVDAVTAVSRGTYEPLVARHPHLAGRCTELPIGFERRDFERLGSQPRPNRWFDPTDGCLHFCYVGTLLPLGFETLRALLDALVSMRAQHTELGRRVRLHFFGTSNQSTPAAAERVMPLARERGLADAVTEVAPRLDYLDALAVQTAATAILLLGSSEPHYTASKLYPALLAQRPILAVYHSASSVVEVLRRAAWPPSARVVTYDDVDRAGSRTETIAAALTAIAQQPEYELAAVNLTAIEAFSAPSLAGRLAGVLDRVRRA